jgi:hypothetical protein
MLTGDPKVLLLKLRHDLARMEQEPWHPFPAWDFFVTAYHILDWCSPGLRGINRDAREFIELTEPLIEISGHLATLAKHRRAEATKWDDVSATFGSHILTVNWDSGRLTGMGSLIVALTDEHAAALHCPKHVKAVELARRVLARWEDMLKPPAA